MRNRKGKMTNVQSGTESNDKERVLAFVPDVPLAGRTSMS